MLKVYDRKLMFRIKDTIKNLKKKRSNIQIQFLACCFCNLIFFHFYALVVICFDMQSTFSQHLNVEKSNRELQTIRENSDYNT